MGYLINIREATLADLNGILEVESLCFADEKFSKRQFAYLISQAKGTFYVVESNNAILGYLSLLKQSNSKTLRIYSIAIHPEARGQGIGQKLIDMSKVSAKMEGLCQISLEVRIDNDVAISLYKKNGFIVTAIMRNYYKEGVHALKMKLFL